MGRSLSLAIIDLDDTLVSFDGVSEDSWILACQSVSPRLRGIQAAQVARAIRQEGEIYWQDPDRHRIGRLNLPHTRRKIVGKALDDIGIHDHNLAAVIADTYSRIRLDAMYLFEGATETLTSVQRSGLSMALLTNGDSIGQRAKINRFDLAGYFDGIYIEEEIRYGKPEIPAFERILTDFSVSAAETVIVGDNYEWEIRAPAGMGMYTVWVNGNPKRTIPESGPEPDAIISSIIELPRVLNDLV